MLILSEKRKELVHCKTTDEAVPTIDADLQGVPFDFNQCGLASDEPPQH
jgi:hypothetical protein